MEIISRQEAIRRGLNKYFTGKPCANGHIVERYVGTCSCQACVNPTAAAITSEQRSERQRLAEQRIELEKEKLRIAAERTRIKALRLSLSEQRKREHERAVELKSQLVKIRLTCSYQHIKAVREFAYLSAASREPSVTYLQIACPHMAPTILGGGMERYTLACFPDDRETIMEYMVSLQKSPAAIEVETEAIPSLTMQERINAMLKAADTNDGICKHGKYLEEKCEKCAIEGSRK